MLMCKHEGELHMLTFKNLEVAYVPLLRED